MSASLHANLVLFTLLTDIPATAAVLWLLWRGLKQSPLSQPVRMRTWTLSTLIVAAWYGGFSLLAILGTFQTRVPALMPIFPLAVAGPVVIGMIYIRRSPAIQSAVEALPPAWLVGVQFYRVLGAVFVFLTIGGHLPGIFGNSAGYGDIAVGLLAIPTALMLANNSASSRTVARIWNYLGILDLITALTTGFLSSPTPLQQFAFDHPNTLAATYPLAMIPTFMVPLSLILHFVTLRRLRQPQPHAAYSTI